MKHNQTVSGSVLILALWTLFFLAALSLAIGAHVASSLELARRTWNDTVADNLARAGVERAIMEIKMASRQYSSPTNNEAVFKDNDSIEGGVFSVRYEFWAPGQGIVTNYGVVPESKKVNINAPSHETHLEKLIQERCGGDAAGWVSAIKAYREEKANAGLTGKGKFEHLCELLLVPVSLDVFAALEPFLTVDGIGYGGTAVGVLNGRAQEDSRIRFVFDTTGRIKFWHAY